jgi:hypothetical protein
MGDLLRFPGAPVDWQQLDNFEWTAELLCNYAERAASLASRYGGRAATELPPVVRGGRCADCQRTTHVFSYGAVVVCRCCLAARHRVRELL